MRNKKVTRDFFFPWPHRAHTQGILIYRCQIPKSQGSFVNAKQAKTSPAKLFKQDQKQLKGVNVFFLKTIKTVLKKAKTDEISLKTIKIELYKAEALP